MVSEYQAIYGSYSLTLELEADPLMAKLFSCGISSQYGCGRQTSSPF